ncbi:hypothetical protein [Candidatus Nitrosotenuis aquarius]|uniref:hypothetical protein n=1 Tax=Candidatus Nitrosotenuis aquarius TaxID=1846278 RepID=UPI000C1E321D|nr:hypothetical protein [Candidatus Nitrosotenuis aquarius]
MPHIVFDSKIDLEDFAQKFSPYVATEPYIIKLNDLFLSHTKKSVLVPAVAIDEKNQQYLIEILAKDEKTTIRLYPGTDPEKTAGVKMSMGCLAKMIQTEFPELCISKTNIAEFIQ